MLEDAPFIGDWHRSTKLGSGGFGVVWLWQHVKSKEKIAVKKCHVSLGANVSKQKERWEREVDYMTNKIRHVNIVRGIRVKPDTFLSELAKSNPSNMPILIMEYCEGGDLRHQLNDNRNASGMVESEVRNVLQALTSAVYYLHSLSITHRDIKPENVVIHVASDGRKIYKLTDLGYAKPLDLQSIEASLVGTMEYIAPELITTVKYSCSVDYWSLGIIAYEVITGSRPFAPHLPLAQWMLRVRDKKSEHITIVEDDAGNVVYSNRIIAENQISSKLCELLENWFKIALEWNGKQRGCIFERTNASKAPASTEITKPTENDNRPRESTPPIQVLRFFQKIDDILAKKILTIFILTNHKYLSVEIDKNTTNDELLTLIERETQIPKSKCHIILPLENVTTEIDKIGHYSKPIELYTDGYFDKPMIFVTEVGGGPRVNKSYSASSTTTADDSDDLPISVELPASVRNVLVNHEHKLKVHTLRKFASDTLYFVRKENEKYRTCMDGWFNYALQLNHNVELCKQSVKQLNGLIYGVNGALELYGQSLKMAMEKFGDTMELHLVWLEQYTKSSLNMQRLIDACEKITARYYSIHRRSRDAYKCEFLNKRNDQDYYDVINAAKAFDAVRAQILNKNFVVEKPHFELFQCAYKCLKRRDQLLRSKPFTELQRSLNCIHIELNEIKKTLEMAVIPAEKYRIELTDANQRLLKHIWTLGKCDLPKVRLLDVSTSVSDLQRINANINNINGTASQAILNPVSSEEQATRLSSLSQSYGNGPIEFKIDSDIQSDIKDQFGNSILCFGEGNDTKMLMDDNEKLRISIAGLMREIDEEFETAEANFNTQSEHIFPVQ